MKPSPEEFLAALRESFAEAMALETTDPRLHIFEARGDDFDLIEEGYVDSLDLLDILFPVERKFGITIVIEKVILDDGRLTPAALYKAVEESPPYGNMPTSTMGRM